MENENDVNQLPEWYLEERAKLDRAILDAVQSERVNLNIGSKKGFVKDNQKIVFSFNVSVQDAAVEEERKRLWQRFL